MAATTTLREVLNQGISSGNFVDTKIILYSHRDSSGRICRPRALYANSHVLKTVPYFNDRECISTLDIFPRAPHHCLKVLFGNFAESQLKDFDQEAAIDEVGSAEDYGYLSDSDLEDDEDEKSPHSSMVPQKSSRGFTLPTRWRFSTRTRKLSEEHGGHVDKGKVAKITDTAFVTEEHEGHANKGKVVKIPDMAFVT